MTGQIDHDRHKRLWGDVGQKLLSGSRIAIVGSDRLATECAKAASILGVGRIFLIDNANSRGEKFLDMPIEGSKVSSLAKLIQKYLNNECDVVGIHAPASTSWLDSCGELDAVIDASNNPASQAICYDFCSAATSASRRPALFTAAADAVQGKVSYYAPCGMHGYKPDNFDICIPGFVANRQGVIVSNIFAGILVEEYRKWLFLGNKEKFKNVRIAKHDGSLRWEGTNEYLTYYNFYLEKSTKMLQRDLEYSINGFEERKVREEDHTSSERGLEGLRILILGCGAIGNVLADIVARQYPSRVDVADVDIFESTNLNRQPLAYDGVDKYKAMVVSDKINRIAGKQISSPILGFVGEKFDEELIEKAKLKGKAALLNSDWFGKHKSQYHIVFGCFDNRAARIAMLRYSTRHKFNYIDGGSGGENVANCCRTSIYSPGRTNCMRCNHAQISEDEPEIVSHQNAADNALRQSRVEENRAEYEGVVSIGAGGHNCHAEWVDGSIYTSNQIAAALMAGEGRKLFSRPDQLVDHIVYNAQWGSKLEIPKQKFRCRC
jgi:molybdopterin/thiamine biosynthesis adenylyltransferase